MNIHACLHFEVESVIWGSVARVHAFERRIKLGSTINIHTGHRSAVAMVSDMFSKTNKCATIQCTGRDRSKHGGRIPPPWSGNGVEIHETNEVDIKLLCAVR